MCMAAVEKIVEIVATHFSSLTSCQYQSIHVYILQSPGEDDKNYNNNTQLSLFLNENN